MLDYVGDSRPPLHALRALIRDNDAVLAAVAYVKRSGVELIGREVRDLHQRGGRMELLTAFDFGLTDPAALDRLSTFGTTIRIFRGRTYHPKIYLGERGAARQALLGSANLTSGGLQRNVEAGVHVSGDLALPLHRTATAHLRALWRQAAPYQPGTVLAQPPPVLKVAAPTSPRLRTVWEQIRRRFETNPVVNTATGRPNRLLQVHPRQGILVGTHKSPGGKWVEPWMIEVVVDRLEIHPSLRLNPDCTDGLRVHRSSAVFAILGALPGYRLHRTPKTWLERL